MAQEQHSEESQVKAKLSPPESDCESDQSLECKQEHAYFKYHPSCKDKLDQIMKAMNIHNKKVSTLVTLQQADQTSILQLQLIEQQIDEVKIDKLELEQELEQLQRQINQKQAIIQANKMYKQNEKKQKKAINDKFNRDNSRFGSFKYKEIQWPKIFSVEKMLVVSNEKQQAIKLLTQTFNAEINEFTDLGKRLQTESQQYKQKIERLKAALLKKQQRLDQEQAQYEMYLENSRNYLQKLKDCNNRK